MGEAQQWMPPLVPEDEARLRLRRRGWRRWWSGIQMPWGRGARARFSPRRERLRLVGLPAASVQVEVVPMPVGSKPAMLLVHGFSRQVEILRAQPLRLEVIPASVRRFEYPLDEETTLGLARRSLVGLRLSRVLSVRGGSSFALQMGAVVCCPYWVLYEQLAGGRMDFRILDALNGLMGGVLLREALLRALDHADRSGTD